VSGVISTLNEAEIPAPAKRSRSPSAVVPTFKGDKTFRDAVDEWRGQRRASAPVTPHPRATMKPD